MKVSMRDTGDNIEVNNYEASENNAEDLSQSSEIPLVPLSVSALETEVDSESGQLQDITSDEESNFDVSNSLSPQIFKPPLNTTTPSKSEYIQNLENKQAEENVQDLSQILKNEIHGAAFDDGSQFGQSTEEFLGNDDAVVCVPGKISEPVVKSLHEKECEPMEETNSELGIENREFLPRPNNGQYAICTPENVNYAQDLTTYASNHDSDVRSHTIGCMANNYHDEKNRSDWVPKKNKPKRNRASTTGKPLLQSAVPVEHQSNLIYGYPENGFNYSKEASVKIEKNNVLNQAGEFHSDIRLHDAEKNEAGFIQTAHPVFNQPQDLTIHRIPDDVKMKEDLFQTASPVILSQDLTMSSPEIEVEQNPNTTMLESYVIESEPKGLCVIFNNHVFHHLQEDKDSVKLTNRKGSNEDKERLIKVFSQLGFEIHLKENLTANEMLNRANYYARSYKEFHKKSDAFVLCILSHGEGDCVFGSDGKKVPLHDNTEGCLAYYFKGANCPALIGKPKMMFIQACRGPQEGIAVKPHSYQERQTLKPCSHAIQTDGDIPSSQGTTRIQTLPDEADWVIGQATSIGHASFRNEETGSWYITKLCSNLHRYHGRKYDLLKILTRVNLDLSKAEADCTDKNKKTFIAKQQPAPYFTTNKNIYLTCTNTKCQRCFNQPNGKT
ncbi:unnamed protein product [Owenia fusiformis]|uniref:Uncharacterized protein n=1 Tax=Owenia fusiformis TaxID=6347 RepID=A0A8J1TST7_OWEFU|nr:unnamed protein product [Owenia fusiformis]